MKRNMASEATIKEAVLSMSSLNKYAAEVLSNHQVNSCTDITGNLIIIIHFRFI